MKSIIFNTEMVKAVLDGRRSQFRKVIRNIIATDGRYEGWRDKDIEIINGRVEIWTTLWRKIKAKYKVGDILYVKETFTLGEKQIIKPENVWYIRNDLGNQIFYKADLNDNFYDPDFICNWKPSVHLKQKDARIFLKVTKVRVERLEENSYIFVYEFEKINKEG